MYLKVRFDLIQELGSDYLPHFQRSLSFFRAWSAVVILEDRQRLLVRELCSMFGLEPLF